MDAYLKVPWKHFFATAQVIKDYVPEDVDLNQLSISKGQHLIVVSKEGDENGWWKGRFNDQVRYSFSYIFEVFFKLNFSVLRMVISQRIL